MLYQQIKTFFLVLVFLFVLVLFYTDIVNYNVEAGLIISKVIYKTRNQ